MNKRAPLAIFIIVFSLIGIVGLVFWNSIRASFVTPLRDLFLLIFDFLGAFDQVYLWIILVFVLIVLTVVRLGKTKPEMRVDRVVRYKQSHAGRLRFWETQVYLLTRGRIPSRYSVHEIRRLLVSVMGYKQHLDFAEADKRLKAGELVLPPQYDDFSRLDQEAEQPEDMLTELMRSLVASLKGTRQQMIQAREKVLSDLILYMENQLEIEHDH